MGSFDEKIDTGSSTKVKFTSGSICTGIVFSWEVFNDCFNLTAYTSCVTVAGS